MELLANVNTLSEGNPMSVCIALKCQRKLGLLSQGLLCEHLKH